MHQCKLYAFTISCMLVGLMFRLKFLVFFSYLKNKCADMLLSNALIKINKEANIKWHLYSCKYTSLK